MEELSNKVTGDTLKASEWDQVAKEIENVIEGYSEITLTNSDLEQLNKALANKASTGDFYDDTTTVPPNSIRLTTPSYNAPPTEYREGMRVRWRVGASTTGAATLVITDLDNGMGEGANIKTLVYRVTTGSTFAALPSGYLIVGRLAEAVFDSASGQFVIEPVPMNSSIVSSSTTIVATLNAVSQINTKAVNTQTLGGVGGATNLGTFTGDIISDNQPIKTALQQLETATRDYLGKTLDGGVSILENTVTYQVLDMSGGTDTQGGAFDYGASSSDIVIPAGVTKGYFTYHVKPQTSGTLFPFVTVTGTFKVDLFVDAGIVTDAATGVNFTNASIDFAKNTISGRSGVLTVAENEAYDLRMIADFTTSGSSTNMHVSFEFVPIFT